MDLVAVCVLFLSERDRSLSDHTREFLDLAYQTHYPDSGLISLYRAGLNEPLKSMLAIDRPPGTFSEFVKLALQLTGTSLTVGKVEEDLN